MPLSSSASVGSLRSSSSSSIVGHNNNNKNDSTSGMSSSITRTSSVQAHSPLAKSSHFSSSSSVSPKSSSSSPSAGGGIGGFNSSSSSRSVGGSSAANGTNYYSSSIYHNFSSLTSHPMTKLSRIDEDRKYEKAQRQQLHKENFRRFRNLNDYRKGKHVHLVKTILVFATLCLALIGIWHVIWIGKKSTLIIDRSNDSLLPPLDQELLSNLRRHPSILHQQQQEQQELEVAYRQAQQRYQTHKNPRKGGRLNHDTIKSKKEQQSREERINQAIQELKQYQADTEGRKHEFQEEVKAQLEDENLLLAH